MDSIRRHVSMYRSKWIDGVDAFATVGLGPAGLFGDVLRGHRQPFYVFFVGYVANSGVGELTVDISTVIDTKRVGSRRCSNSPATISLTSPSAVGTFHSFDRFCGDALVCCSSRSLRVEAVV